MPWRDLLSPTQRAQVMALPTSLREYEVLYTLTPQNERYEEISRHPDWAFSGPQFPPFTTLIEQFDSLPLEDFQQEFEGRFVDEAALLQAFAHGAFRVDGGERDAVAAALQDHPTVIGACVVGKRITSRTVTNARANASTSDFGAFNT